MTTENMNLQVGARSRTSSLDQWARRTFDLWNLVANSEFALLLIVAIWFTVSVPPAIFHGYHYVEGLTVNIAQSALKDGNWLTPHLYNLRWIERPTILPSIIAVISLPFGDVYPFVARVPTLIALLAGTYLIWRTLRPIASTGAAMFGALAFLASPTIIRYYITAVADLPLTVLLFGTFLVWWNSFVTGRISIARWIVIGAMLAVAALFKGPQPLAYFFLGVFVFAMLTSTWWQIPGLALAGVLAAIPTALWYAYVFAPGDQGEWLRYTRLSSNAILSPHPLANAGDFIIETLPPILLAAALLLVRPSSVRQSVPKHFILALGCYAFVCTFVILFWPAAINPRYILPMVPALCVLAGIAFDALAARRTAIVATGIAMVVGLLGYAVVHSANDIFFTPAYIHSKTTGAEIAELVQSAPAPIYRTIWDSGLNELAYVPYRVATVPPETIPQIAKPAWLLVPAEQAPSLISQSNGHTKSRLAFGPWILLRLE